MFYYRYDVWCMTPTCALSMVSVNSAVFKGFDRLLDKPGLIKSVGVDKTLDIIFIADTGKKYQWSWFDISGCEPTLGMYQSLPG